MGLFKTNSTTALIQKVSKDNADADDVMRRVAEIEQVASMGLIWEMDEVKFRTNMS